MSREIKFRGIDKSSGNWVYGLLARGNGAEAHLRYILPNGLPGEHHRVLARSVGQFTGLQDLHGEDIYEKDIVDMYNREFRARVVFSKGSFDVATTGNSVGWYNREEIEVIGNIHENPELLEGK